MVISTSLDIGVVSRGSSVAAPSDEDLARRFIDTGNQHDFITLINRYLPRLRRMLYTLCSGSRELIEDAEQEIIASLYGSLPRFRFQARFGTFFYRFSRNVTISLLRRIGSERRRLERVRYDSDTRQPPPTPDELVDEQEARQDVTDALQRLPEQDRFLLHLREFEALSLREIAAIMICPVGTIKSRLHRARTRLRTLLEEKGYE